VDQEKKKNKKVLSDFETMTSMIKESESDSKALNDGNL